MVDLDKLKGGSDDSKEEKETSTTTTEKDTSSGDAEPFTMDEVSEPGSMEMSDTSKRWADEHGSLAYDDGTGSGIKRYMKKQIEECEELHENIEEMAGEHTEGVEEFTLYFHTLMLNLSRNRIGIMKTIKDEFGKSDDEALKLTNKICEKAGEQEMVENVLNLMVKELWE
jgi:hypothetical protein